MFVIEVVVGTAVGVENILFRGVSNILTPLTCKRGAEY